MRPFPARTVAAVACGATLTLVLSACGGASGGADAGDTALPGADQYLASACPQSAVQPTDKQLTYWSMWTADEPQGKVLKHAIDCFGKQTGVKVDVQWLGRKFLTQNLAPALNTDTVPDLFDQDVSQVKAAVVTPGGTQGVDEVLGMKVGEGDKTVKDVVPATFYDTPQNKDAAGHLVQIPYELIGNAWWYDKSQVPGFTAPKTTDELFALFDKAKSAGKAAVSQDGDINFYNAYYFTQLAQRFVGPGGLIKAASDKSGQSWKSDPGFLKAAQIVEKLAKGHYFVDGWDASKFPQIQQRWADGEASYLFVGSWAPSETREYLAKQGGGKKIDYGSFQFPMPAGATHDVVEQLPIGFSLTAKAKHPETAKAFMAYFLNSAILKGIPAVADNISSRPDLDVPADLKEVKAALDNTAKEHNIFMDGLDGAFGGKFVDSVFYPVDNDLLKGKLSAEQFVDQLAAKTADYWKSQT
ncbi:ABC transporter substrate-binding protein [Kutzneria albida]|uniref:Putative secreted protein n=1 Tax=Kutzneria albida DSM 43870 TaxID=1449976 RepID=W5WBA5_9PSEU|nr:ABC transporter substrate-binding protein [Kutzneria albida]AHH95504.1 putative secreted protein [Kutzneria albida DSM 43870]